ncbi:MULTISPECIES: LysR family transcriptional regulator [unclassified Sinorhizobium]|uniref:LysR family transcriptional regulator n=1 Tax=unclassified Sinorhizobium TaxID=2613772 RepID=UPI0024C31FD6|nr:MULTISPECIES: LysR family transcriptional regulator [unclassified Sinorhizobium]MDK1373639.1 LysR family transcriptional regulator [Sinorhizobium sp. 6-70]MDK1477799.1 LysR family transcriptional regulator [Sinorhizobium sp. 6-117]
MVRRYYELPSLTALAVFEASARHSSLKLAASELNVTPSAVSRQIKAIEEELGVQLFVRSGKGVALTAEGEELYDVLANSFSRISDIARSIKRRDKARNVKFACSDVFATMWLIPQMPDFWRRHPDIMVDHLISDDMRNFRRAEVELRVRFGPGAWSDETSEFLFDECVYPVCSPNFAARFEGATMADLPDLPLLDVNWVGPDWVGWEEALRRAGLPHTAFDGKRFGKFNVALQAAMADQGVVIGWHRIVGDLVEQGTLVRFTDLVIRSPGGYYLTWNSHRELSSATLILREWLRSIAKVTRNNPCPTATIE